MVRRLLTAWVVMALLAGVRAAAAPQMDVDQIFAATPPWGAQPSHIVWAPDGTSFLYVLPSQDALQPLPLRQYDVHSGQSRVVIDPASYGAKTQTPDRVAWSPDGKSVSFTLHGTLYVRDMSTGLDRTIAKDVSDALWSSQGNAIAYTRNADLYVARLEPKLHTTRLTLGGVPSTILNGDLDWVYPEEFNTQHGFAWSADGREIAYMQMDERPVTNFPIVDFLTADNAIVYERYPLAGERNPRVSLHVVDLETLASRLVYDAAPRDEYLPFFAWKPRSRTLVAEVLDRSQQRFRVLAIEPGSAPSVLYEQRDSKWVDAIPLPVWLSNGTSLWLLERENVMGLYRRSAAGKLTRLTTGFRVDQIAGVDEKKNAAYVSGAYPTRRDRALLAVSLSNASIQNLTAATGTHSVTISPTNGSFVDTYSGLNEPPQTDLVSINGTTRATLAARSEALRSHLLPAQMLSIDSSYGKLDAYMIKPPDFSASRKYPVVMYVYGGPEAPTTANAFGEGRGLFHQLLARRGFIVFSIDGPGSQIDNESHVRLLYHNLGAASFLGQQIGAQYLRSLPYVDSSRIGIWGWSFGGYETAYALTHSPLFKAGVAGAPVIDWHLYDSIYTERYMGSPQNDPKAYDAASALNAAGNLQGDLLIVHGTADDNVHISNAIAFLQALISANKTHVDFLAYPRQRHHFIALADLRQMYAHMLEWWQVHL